MVGYKKYLTNACFSDLRDRIFLFWCWPENRTITGCFFSEEAKRRSRSLKIRLTVT
jgi:hypothetical protein